MVNWVIPIIISIIISFLTGFLLSRKLKIKEELINSKWRLKYTQDIEELKKIFKESEKNIRAKSVSASRRSLIGKFIEKFIPFLENVPYEASDMHFLGQPVDYIVFEGLHENEIDKVIFLEIKSGKSKLTKREGSLKKAINEKRVEWKEINISVPDSNKIDIENKETIIDDFYEKVDNKIKELDK